MIRRLTLSEAAEVARMPLATLRTKVSRGEIPSTRPGRLVLIRADDLEAYLDGKRFDPVRAKKRRAPAPRRERAAGGRFAPRPVAVGGREG